MQKEAIPFTQEKPAGQERQLLAPLLEYDVPVHELHVLALGPENVPAAHCVAKPFTQDDPAGQGLQLLAPLIEYDVPVHGVIIPFKQYEPARHVLTQLLATAAENIPLGHCTIVTGSLQYHHTSYPALVRTLSEVNRRVTFEGDEYVYPTAGSLTITLPVAPKISR